jgi:hypothetical protein
MTKGKRLIAAATEALAIANGTTDPGTYKVHPPAANSVRKVQDKGEDHVVSRKGKSTS